MSFFPLYTGIQLNQSNLKTKYDSLEDAYQVVRGVVINYAIVQMGIACYRWEKSLQKYLVSIFTFYLHKNEKLNGSLTMLSQVSAA
jgi:hypothetical protein